jgi:ABC-type arginine/histidine transport system permease subunit
VSLAQHSISSVHKPAIDIVINEMRFGTLEFLVTLAIDVEAFQIEIEDATIKRMRTGKLHASGEVGMDGVPIYRKKLEPVRLPLTVDLGKGVRIGE